MVIISEGAVVGNGIYFFEGTIYTYIYIEMILIHLLAGVNLILHDFTIHFGLETVGVVEV